jgi:hypothetical protein
MSNASLAPDRPAPEEGQNIRDSEAEYTLEYWVTCPSCHDRLNSVRAVRLLRTRVNFTSLLPRHGRVVICPNCRAILSAALTLG